MPIDSLSSGASPWTAPAQVHHLFRALEQADVAGAREALARGGVIPAVDADGWTPLMWAALHGEQSLLDLCLPLAWVRQGINAINNDGATALMIAAQEWDAPMMMRLLQLGANPNLVHPCGCTALLLFLASCSEDADVELIEAFVQAGADLAATDAQHTNALMLAADKFSRDAVTYIAEHMNPQRLNDANEQGYTAMFFGAQRNLEMVRLLLEKGCKADLAAPDGRTPAQMAWDCGASDVASFLQEIVAWERDVQARLAAQEWAMFLQETASPEDDAQASSQTSEPED